MAFLICRDQLITRCHRRVIVIVQRFQNSIKNLQILSKDKNYTCLNRTPCHKENQDFNTPYNIRQIKNSPKVFHLRAIQEQIKPYRKNRKEISPFFSHMSVNFRFIKLLWVTDNMVNPQSGRQKISTSLTEKINLTASWICYQESEKTRPTCFPNEHQHSARTSARICVHLKFSDLNSLQFRPWLKSQLSSTYLQHMSQSS